MKKKLTVIFTILSMLLNTNVVLGLNFNKSNSISKNYKKSVEMQTNKKMDAEKGRIVGAPQTYPTVKKHDASGVKLKIPKLKLPKAKAKSSKKIFAGTLIIPETYLENTKQTLLASGIEISSTSSAPTLLAQESSVTQAIYSANPLLSSNGTTLEEYDSADSVVAYYSTVQTDTANTISGSGSVKWASQISSGGNYCAIDTTGSYNLADMENFEINLNTPDVSQITALGIVLYSEDMNSYYANYIGQYELNNGWNKIIRLKSDFAKNGDLVNWDNIKCLRIFLFNANGSNPTINIDRVACNIKGNSKLLFTFEDGFYDTKTNAYPILKAKDFKATVYPVKNIANYGDMDFLDIYDLNSLYAEGWDIGNHTESHPSNLNMLSDADKQKEFVNTRDWLVSKGWSRGADHVSYSMGNYDSSLDSIFKSMGVKTAKAATYGIQNIPAESLSRLKCIPVGMSTSPQYIKSQMDRAIASGSTIVLMLHKVEDNPIVDIDTSTASFQEIVNYAQQLKNQGMMDVVTISEWYSLYTTGDKGDSTITPTTAPNIPAQPVLPIISKIDPKPDTSLVQSKGTVIDECDVTTNWNRSRRAKIEIDTTNTVSGTSSLKLSSQVPDGGNNFIVERHNNLNQNLSDMSNLEFNFYIPDKNQINSIAVVFYSDDIYHGSYFVNYIGGYELINGWNKIRRVKSDFIQFGSGASWSNIKCMRINVFAKDGFWPSINIDRVASNVAGVSKLLFTFDDAWYDVKSNAYPILQAKGYKGTLWAAKELATEENSEEHFLNVSELNEMYNNGWDIGSHTVNHPDDINLLTDQQKKKVYLDNQNWLVQNGWTRSAYHVCYPQGSYSDKLIEILRGIGVKTGRTTEYGIQPVAVDNIYKLKCIAIGKDVPVSLIKSEIDRAINTGSSIMFMLHKVEQNPVEVYEESISKFQEIVDYTSQRDQEGKIEVQTISQWYNDYVGHNINRIEASTNSVNANIGDTAAAVRINAVYDDLVSEDVTTKCTWSTSNSSVATVNTDGSVKAISKGTATITAKYEGGYTASYTLAVLPLLSSIKASYSTVYLSKGKTTTPTITAVYSDKSTKNITALCSWTSSNSRVAKVDSKGLITGLSSGTATIKASYSGKSTSISICVW